VTVDLLEAESSAAEPAPALVALPPAEAAAAARARSRVAWLILWCSAAICFVVVSGLFWGVGYYREQAMTPRTATLEILGGTVLYQPEEAVRESLAQNKGTLVDGDRIRTTAEGGMALISLPDGSTVLLWPETQVQIKQLRTSTFNNNRSTFLLVENGGHTRVTVAVPQTLERRFEVQTPQGRAILREGSYRIEVGPQGTEVAVSAGSATVSAKEESIELLHSERTIIAPNGQPSPRMPAVRNLVRNGDFAGGFAGWAQGSRNEEDGVPGQVSLFPQDERFSVRMRRQGSLSKHGETFLQQTINRDVRDETSLKLNMDVKVVSQTLSGGGVLGSEYPLMVKLRYRDAYGSESFVVRGFYVDNRDNRPTTNGVQVPANQWTSVSIDLFDDKSVQPRPAQLLSLEVEGSGWDYESFVTGIQLLAQ
jgi:ferric-dicitrate binding protein FerR (iron transport regulator)